MTGKKANKRPLPKKSRSALVFEELEPRLLLSADLPIDIPAVLAPDRGEDEPVSVHQEITPTAVTEEQYTSRELVFVDTDTPDYQLLVDDILGNSNEERLIEVILLDNSGDGIAQITSALSEYNELDAVHLISHGSDGSIDLGGTHLEFDTLLANTTSIQGWSEAFSEQGDILIYGCNLAASEDGQGLVNALARLTGADVAASDDLTGNADQGGDWDLEYQSGQIDATVVVSAAVQAQFEGVLETIRDEFTTVAYNNNDGTQNWSTDWIESEGGGPSTGEVKVDKGELRLNATALNDNVYREADLSSASSALLDFDYLNSLVSSQTILLQVSSNGGVSYTSLQTFDATTNTGTGAKSIDISAYMAADTRIRFLVSAVDGTPEALKIDNLQISYTDTPPTITSNGAGATASINVAENTTSVTTVTATDADLDTLTYSKNGGADAALFSIDPNSGVLTFNSVPNYESPTDTNLDNVYEVTVRVNDGNGGIDTQAISVTVTDVNEAPTVSLTNLVNNLSEDTDTSSAIKIADIVITDDALGTNALTLAGADAASFEIVGSELRLKAGTSLDFETKASFDVTVQVDDAAITGSPDGTALHTLNITDVNEVPTDISISNTAVDENTDTTGGYSVGTLSATDVDAGDSHSYTIFGGADAALFTIGGAGSNKLILDDGVLDFETQSSYQVTVRVTDSGTPGLTYDELLTITVNDVTETTTVGDGIALADRDVWGGGYNFGVDAVTLQTDVGSDVLTDLTVTFSGNDVNDVAANGVKIWRDDGVTANQWDESDTLIASASFVGNTANFSGLSETINTTATQYIITYDIAGTATPGNTLQGSITAATVGDGLINNDSVDATLTVIPDMVHETSVYKMVYAPGIVEELYLKNSSSSTTNIMQGMSIGSIYASIPGSLLLTWDPDATVTTLVDNGVEQQVQMTGRLMHPSGASYGSVTTNITFYEDRVIFDVSVTMDVALANEWMFMTYAVWDDALLDESFEWSSNNSGIYNTEDPATNFNSGNQASPISYQGLFEMGATDGLVNATMQNISNYGTSQLKNTDNDGGSVDIAFQKNNPVLLTTYQAAVMYSFDTTTTGFDTSITEGRQDDYITPATLNFGIPGGDGALVGDGFADERGAYTLDDNDADDVVKFEFQVGSVTPRYSPVFEITNWNSAAPLAIDVDGVTKNIGTDYTAAVTGTTLYVQYLGNLSSDSVFTLDANSAPTDIVLSNTMVDENVDTTGGYSVGTLTATDVDAGDSHSYTIIGGADAALFTIGGAGSDELILDDGVLNFETQSSYQVNVRVTDSSTPGLTYDNTVTITVNDLNDAPVLVGANNLNSISEDPVTNPGTLVSDLMSSHVSDADSGALSGIAVVGVDNTNGTWEYTIDGGSNWLSLGSPSPSFARLLAADANTLVRFVPTADYNGTVTNGITFHAWDQTTGNNGDVVNISGFDSGADSFSTVSYSNNDGTTAWTTDWIETDNNGGGASGGYMSVNGGNLQLQLAAGDTGDNLYREIDLSGATIATLAFDYQNVLAGEDEIRVQVSGNGGSSYTTVLTFSGTQITGTGTANIDVSSYISSDTRIRFYVFKNDAGNDLFIDNVSVAYDNGDPLPGGTTAFSAASQSSDITVTPVNDAPTDISLSNTAVDENTDTTGGYSVGTLSATDVDVGDSHSYTIVGGADAALFTIGGAGSDELILDDGVLNFETQSSYQVNVRVTDSSTPGLTYDKTVTITVNDLNDAPMVSLTNLVNNLSEDTDTSSAIKIADIVITDDALGTNTLTLAGADSAFFEIVGSELRLKAGTSLDFETKTSFDVTVQVDDVAIPGAPDDTALHTLNITDVNEAPVVNATASDTGTEDTDVVYTHAQLLTLIGATDVDDANAALNIAITNVINGTLALSGGTGGAGTTFTFTPTVNFVGNLTFDYQVSDDAAPTPASSAISAATVALAAVNDTPTMIFPVTVQFVNEDTPLVFSLANGNQIAVGDVDANGGDMLINFLSYNGTLTLNGIAGLTFTTGDGVADTAMTFTGSIAAINVALDGLSFTPDANFTGGTNFQMWVNDQNNTGSGGPKQTTAAALISVAGVNDVPVATANTVSTTEDNAYTFGVGDFTYTDVEGDSLVSVTITNLNLVGGTLEHSGGTTVTNGMTITAAQIATLVYTPAGNANGTPLATFDFTVNDAGAGVSAAQMDIDVTPLNDTPTAANHTVTTNEDTTYVFTLTDFGFSDIDGDSLSQVQITTLEANGSLQLSGADVVLNQVIAAADIIAGNLTFTPVVDANAVGYDSFGFSVNDGAVDSATSYTMIVDVTAVNDAPIHSVPAAQSTSGNTPLSFSSTNGNSITVADPDASGAPVEVTLSASNGTLSLAGTSGLSFTAGDGSSNAAMTFTGTAAAINAALNGLSFQADAGFEGMATVQIITDDLGNVGTGGALNALDRVNITVAASTPTGIAQDTLPPLDELILEDSLDLPAPEPGSTRVNRANVDPAAEEATDAASPSSGSVTTPATNPVVDVMPGSGRGVPTQADVSLPGSVPLFDQDSQPHDDDRPSSVRLIAHAIRQGLVDPFTYAKMLNPLQPDMAIWESIEAMMEQMDGRDTSWYKDDQVLTTTTATGLTVSFTVGYVSWLLRAGYLSASLMSVLPLWREFDPLPVLATTQKRKRKSADRGKDSAETNDIESESIFTSNETV